MIANSVAPGHVPLAHLGVIRVQGPDAIAFLHGQLTQDFALLPPDQARLAAWCSPKGRMLVSLIGFSSVVAEGAEPAVLLVLWRDRIEAMLKRLRMFVLRAKVTLTDVSDELALHGLLGDTALAAAPELQRSWQRAHRADGVDVVRLPGAMPPAALSGASGQALPELARALWVAPRGQMPEGPALPLAAWLTAEVWSGVAPVMTATAEAFVPQMLNYESVGGVNFKKGCYPGQEIVARSQFRGTLKQRAFVGRVQGAVQNGDEVWTTGEDAGVVGTVALAAPAESADPAEAGSAPWVIASLKLSAVDERLPLAIGGASGPALAGLGLPYALADDL
ncbi:hypothetical protein CCO03_12845 [Comamonas serinivorans]|uniref:Uncharacterized protein n=1 Tax=Comamonas serinivorans TaxID=1082851 RepID=A0A1Y0EPF7_9BURK|nr:folate-binding protein YgfZ [Comamonas serinivorans]ARU05456.1 hypothetical protein CCO03_12845 [Comamonas serinivorans]